MPYIHALEQRGFTALFDKGVVILKALAQPLCSLFGATTLTSPILDSA